ncbi:MAG: O-antigen ligase family protein [bacterium]|nr:O-antigen ligase family protein [bacterium]
MLSIGCVVSVALLQIVSTSLQIPFPRMVWFPEGDFPFLKYYSTIGHPNFLAAILGVGVSLGVMALERGREKWLWAGFLVAVMALSMFTRSLIALFIVLPVLFMLLLRLRALRLSRWALSGVCGVVFLVAVGVWGNQDMFRGNSFSVRGYIYQVLSPAVRRSLVLGYGPGRFGAVFVDAERDLPLEKLPLWRKKIDARIARQMVESKDGFLLLPPSDEHIFLKKKLSGDLVLKAAQKRDWNFQGEVFSEKAGTTRLFIERNGIKNYTDFNSIGGPGRDLRIFKPVAFAEFPGWEFIGERSRLPTGYSRVVDPQTGKDP